MGLFSNKTAQKIATPEGTIMQLKGVNALLTLYEKKVVIEHSGAGAMVAGISGEHSFMLKDIIGIELNKGGTMGSRGSIFFNHKGSQSMESNDTNFGMDSLKKAGSKNAVLFVPIDADSFILFQNKVEEMMENAQESGSTVVNQVSIPDEIKKLNELKEQGILTEEEFQDKKKALLDKM
jgi:hypothetical protein